MLHSNVKITQKNGLPHLVTMPYAAYLALVEAAEDKHDIRLIAEADARNIGESRVTQAQIDEMLGVN